MNSLKIDGLRERNALALRTTVILFGLAFLALIGALAHVETAAGPNLSDVHVPIDWLRGFSSASFPIGEPYDVGTGGGKVVQWIVFAVSFCAELGSIVLLIWALRKKQRRLVLLALFLIIVVGRYTPVPKVLVAGTGKAVSVETAERLLTAKPDNRTLFMLASVHEKEVKAYVRAQIAYAKGDLSTARKLSAGVKLPSLGSPIEAPYRLQFLQDRYQGLTTACFINLGCLTEQQRRDGFVTFVWLACAFALCGFSFWTFGFVLTQRLARIDALISYANQTRSSPVRGSPAL